MRKIRLAKLDIVTNYKNTEKAGVIKVMRRKICDGILGDLLLRDAFEWMILFGVEGWRRRKSRLRRKKLRLWGIDAIDAIEAIDTL